MIDGTRGIAHPRGAGDPNKTATFEPFSTPRPNRRLTTSVSEFRDTFATLSRISFRTIENLYGRNKMFTAARDPSRHPRFRFRIERRARVYNGDSVKGCSSNSAIQRHFTARNATTLDASSVVTGPRNFRFRETILSAALVPRELGPLFVFSPSDF